MHELYPKNLVKLTKKEAIMLNSNVLAYVGDAVYSLSNRSKLAYESGLSVNKLNKIVVAKVNAKAEHSALNLIWDSLTEEERDVAMRARNTKTQTKAKNFSWEDYKHATAFEAVIGYLYLIGEDERLNTILQKTIDIKEG